LGCFYGIPPNTHPNVSAQLQESGHTLSFCPCGNAPSEGSQNGTQRLPKMNPLNGAFYQGAHYGTKIVTKSQFLCTP
jgi:hypothetical protein